MNITNDIVPPDTENKKTVIMAPAPFTGTPTPEMLQWLTDNREDYEFYMLHAMMHDPLRRITLLSVPVTPDDFRREEYSIVIRALYVATKVMGVIGQSLTNPPTEEFLRTYVDSAVRQAGMDDDVEREAMRLVRALQDPSFSEQHYCVSPYFEAWYGSARSKKAARELIKVDIPDVRGILEKLQTDLAAASPFTASLDECKFDFDNQPEPPEPLLKLGDHTICTPGNIVNLQGAAKTAKSAVVGAIIASTLVKQGNLVDTFGFTSDSPAGRAVVHFDTEQSAHDHDALIRRAYLRALRRENVQWLHSYCITGMEPAMCWDFLLCKIRTVAQAHAGIMMVIIDGIADFCNDPNDADECFGLVRNLHRLAREYECGVLTVLHENPGSSSGKTRGHLGSQLERKAETSLRLKKDAKTGISVMWADSARHCFIPQGAGWRFHWCNNASMHVSLFEVARADGVAKPAKNAKYADEVSRAFERDEILSYADLIARVTTVTGLARSTAKNRIPEYLDCELLQKDPDGRYWVIRDQTLGRAGVENATAPLSQPQLEQHHNVSHNVPKSTI